MRLTTTLLNIAVLSTAGCSSTAAIAPSDAGSETGPTGNDAGPIVSEAGNDAGPGGNDAAAPDGGDAGVPACGGCNCGSPTVSSGDASPSQACALAESQMVLGTNTACSMFCDGLNGQTVGPPYFCTLPSDYLAAFNAAQSDGGTPSTDGGPTCPTWQGNVVVQCGYQCLGRRTDGIADPEHASGTDEGLGATFAERAYLEAVSVHAFARLERELAAQGAPAVLLRDVRRARRDEIRHAAMMARLARRYGWAPTLPEAPLDIQVREAFAIARENAVEGCVRETYGAVVGLVEARGSRDPEVRRAMESISADECRHAELSWAIAAWMRPRLTTGEREAIDRAMQDAIARLARDGDSRLVELLTERVWRQPPVAA